MKIFYTDCFVLPLPPAHRFPMRKYALLRERIAAARLSPRPELCIPPAATDEQLLRVHNAAYLQHVKAGTLSPAEVRRIGFPWSPGLVERSRRSTGATVAAARAALDDGAAVNLAGGTHHAFTDAGQGFCVFNDMAVAARALQAEGCVARILIVDTDVHQGNGTAAIFADDASVYTLSIHGAKNFPFHKERSDLDIALPDGAADDAFLTALDAALPRAISACRPDVVFYLSGADPYVGDRLGKLALTKAGLAARDALVFEYCRRAGCPVAVAMGGGYAPDLHDIVEIHFQTVLAAARYCENGVRRAAS